MSTRMKTLPVVLLLLSFALAACGTDPALPQSSGGVQIWIDLPLNGSQLPSAPVNLITHASGDVPITDLEYRVDDLVFAEVSVSTDADGLVMDEQIWEEVSVGNHLIQVRALDSDGSWSDAAEIWIYLGEPTPIPLPEDLPDEPEPTLAPITPATILPPTFTPAVFNFLGSDCRQQSATIRIETEPEGSVYSMVVFLRFSDPDLEYDTGWDAGHSMTPEGNGAFRYTVTSEGFTRFADRINLRVRTQFIATDEQGLELARSPVFDGLLLTTTCSE